MISSVKVLAAAASFAQTRNTGGGGERIRTSCAGTRDPGCGALVSSLARRSCCGDSFLLFCWHRLRCGVFAESVSGYVCVF